MSAKKLQIIKSIPVFEHILKWHHKRNHQPKRSFHKVLIKVLHSHLHIILSSYHSRKVTTEPRREELQAETGSHGLPTHEGSKSQVSRSAFFIIIIIKNRRNNSEHSQSNQEVQKGIIFTVDKIQYLTEQISCIHSRRDPFSS